MLAGLFLAELICVGWSDSSLRRLVRSPAASIRSDITAFWLMQMNLYQAIKVVLTFGVGLISGAWLREQWVQATGVTANLSELPFAVQLAVCYALFTFLDYWAHRLGHTHWFWPLHRFHHAADDFCILTAWRVHPADITAFVLASLPMAVLGPSIPVVATLGVILVYVRFLIHSRYAGELGWIGRTLIQAPVHHRLHHMLDVSVEPTCNFSLLPLWDRLFGTWRPRCDAHLAIGVAEPYRHGAFLLPDLWRDYCEWLRQGVAALARLARRLRVKSLGIAS